MSLGYPLQIVHMGGQDSSPVFLLKKYDDHRLLILTYILRLLHFFLAQHNFYQTLAI